MESMLPRLRIIEVMEWYHRWIDELTKCANVFWGHVFDPLSKSQVWIRHCVHQKHNDRSQKNASKRFRETTDNLEATQAYWRKQVDIIHTYLKIFQRHLP